MKGDAHRPDRRDRDGRLLAGIVAGNDTGQLAPRHP